MTPPSLQTRKQVARFATIALVSIAYFAVIIVVLHVLRPDHNPIRQPTSEYAVGPYGSLMTSAFFSMSVASLALAFGLYRGDHSRDNLGLVLGSWDSGVSASSLQ